MQANSDVKTSFQFISEYFVLFEDVRDIEPSSETDRKEWIVALHCENGVFQIQLDGKPCTVKKNDLLLCTPRSILEDSMMSPDFRGKIIGISSKFGKEVFPNSANIWHQAFYLAQNSLIHLPQEEVAELRADYEYIKRKIIKTDNSYYKDTMRCLIQALIYRMASVLQPVVDVPLENDALMSKDYLFKEFMELLIHTKPTPRSVAWYGEKLNKTPKYLSSVIKKASGKTASEWILDVVVSEITDLLKNSPKSIKEIADELDFPSLSFFGRYVRMHLGVSPTEFRRKKGSI